MLTSSCKSSETLNFAFKRDLRKAARVCASVRQSLLTPMIRRLPAQLKASETKYHQFCSHLRAARDQPALKKKTFCALTTVYYRLANSRRRRSSKTNNKKKPIRGHAYKEYENHDLEQYSAVVAVYYVEVKYIYVGLWSSCSMYCFDFSLDLP